MKNIAAVLTFCLFCFSVEATVTGNPAFPKIIQEGAVFSSVKSMSLRVGYEGNFILDRKLEQKALSKRVEDFSFYLNSGVATINFLNRLDLFASYGMGRIETDWIINDGPDVLYYLDLQTRYDYAYSFGTNIIFCEWGKVCLSAGGRYFFTKPSISSFSKAAKTYPLSGNKIKFWEWQADIGLSYKIDIFTPYICAKYSKAKSRFSIENVIISSDGSDTQNFKSKNNFGMALGCAFSNEKFFMLNAEVRLVDEEAFTVSGEFKF